MTDPELRGPSSDRSADASADRPRGSSVRLAGDRDTASIAELYRQEAELHAALEGGFTLTPGFDWEGAVRALLEAPRHRIWVALDDDREIAGFLFARIVGRRAGSPPPRRSWRRAFRRIFGWARRPRLPRGPAAGQLHSARTVEPYGVIEDVFVRPERRRGGHAGALVAASEEWFRSEGLATVQLEVSTDNQPAVRFWRRLGFTPFRERMRRRL